jgi:hypothetical protein
VYICLLSVTVTTLIFQDAEVKKEAATPLMEKKKTTTTTAIQSTAHH